ncbi:MAG: glutamine--fructose-6-phosphate transaminase (isomerizing) [Frankiaceae bacterium]|jgi:glucosamine--fructose-6-phosphate aminotransferase (isomerizing)|nr:glutamine--fructose-6-phosphate transaminase (isomerizing) [Frankiaceae bacterium]
MCGIIGYIGTRPAVDIVADGLRRLEYRGYDSAGTAIAAAPGVLRVAKRAGRFENLEKALGEDRLEGRVGIGHTRWATHGGPTDRNAHPHLDAAGRIAVIHNGIIENYAPLRAELAAAGVPMASETDTEVVAHLLGRLLAEAPGLSLAEALRRVCLRLSGAFTLVAIDRDDPSTLAAARRTSPLVIGVGEGEMFVASDVAAFIEHTREAVELGQDQVVELTADGHRIWTFDGEPVAGAGFHIDWDLAAAEKGGYDSFMLKEIDEQPGAVAETLLGRFVGGRIVLDEQRPGDWELSEVAKVLVVACGTAMFAGLIAKQAIEHWARLPVEVEIASEFRYRDSVLDSHTLVVAISQSGETIDTLEAVRHARAQRARVLAICNTNGAQIPREADAVFYTHAGPEIGVAATKTFLSQVAAVEVVALALAQARGALSDAQIAREFAALAAVPEQIRRTLGMLEPARRVAERIAHCKAVLFLGRQSGYPLALEGALKLKELAYMHAEGFAAGELKHGPIALIEDGLPVVVVMPSPAASPLLHAKMLSNIAEVRARGAWTIVIAAEGDAEAAERADEVLWVPDVAALHQPLVAALPLQALAAHIALVRGEDIDKPRNLAKAVTVE